MREHLVQHRGGYRTPEADKPHEDAADDAAAARASAPRRSSDRRALRRDPSLRRRDRRKAHSGCAVPTVDAACAAAIDMGVPTYRFVRRYIERRVAPQLALRQIDPLIRELTQYRDLINHMTKETE
jgi:hypothetical protein